MGVVFFLTEGRVVFITDDDIPYKEMVRGSYFGDGDILFKRKRSTTAKASVESHMLTLSKQAFEAIVVPEYPELVVIMKKVARERDSRFEQAENRMLNYMKTNAGTPNKLTSEAPVPTADTTPVPPLVPIPQKTALGNSVITIVPLGFPLPKAKLASIEANRKRKANEEKTKSEKEAYRRMSVEARLSVNSAGMGTPILESSGGAAYNPGKGFNKLIPPAPLPPPALNTGSSESSPAASPTNQPMPATDRPEEKAFAVGSQMSLIKEEQLEEEDMGEKEDSASVRRASIFRCQLGGIEEKLKQHYAKQNTLDGRLQGIEEQMKKLVEMLKTGDLLSEKKRKPE